MCKSRTMNFDELVSCLSSHMLVLFCDGRPVGRPAGWLAGLLFGWLAGVFVFQSALVLWFALVLLLGIAFRTMQHSPAMVSGRGAGLFIPSSVLMLRPVLGLLLGFAPWAMQLSLARVSWDGGGRRFIFPLVCLGGVVCPCAAAGPCPLDSATPLCCLEGAPAYLSPSLPC